ncbi:MAG: hypothetical protein IJ151_05240 [Bacteroidales bacterium]|nr:hypothetical protein [Bacteroidales bacterium]
MQAISDKSFKDRLHEYLLEACTSKGLLKGVLLSSPDMESAWFRYAPSYYPDAIREFNNYQEYSLACAGYLGMAVAFLWDKDWARYKDIDYSFFQGERGFDDMDDHITGNILHENKFSVAAMQFCSTEAYHFYVKECLEPGTAEAYQMFLITVKAMFKLGAAIELCHLGYKFDKVNLAN